MPVPELEVVPDAEALAATTVSHWVAAFHHAVAVRGRFVVALAGGSTPLPTYRALALRHDLPWERALVTWGDERLVPLSHPDRNELSARDTFLGAVGVPESQILGWGEGDDAAGLARAHEERLRDAIGDPPEFDLVLLGLGADGHTASLFPGSAELEAPGLSVATTAPDGSRRLSLTPAALSNAEEVLVLVAGADKRDALHRTLVPEALAPEALAPEGDERALPLRALAPRGRFVLLADAAAASGPANGVRVEG